MKMCIRDRNIGVLDIIPEMEHIGNYIDCTDRYLLAITGIDNDLYNTIPYKLIKGNYPASADELLVANNTVYNGEILKTGDVIELDIKERHDADGNILGDEELSVSDVYTDIATRKYTICGIYDSSSFTTGTFIHNAYSGKSGTGSRIYYYTCNSHDKARYEAALETFKQAGKDVYKRQVYVFGDANGNKDHIIVNEKVTDDKGKETLNRTESDGEVPVSMKVTYTLDGNEVTPEELAGKSGKVTMRFDYTNNTKDVPFTMITGMVLPADVFSNVEITNLSLIHI